MEMGIETLVPAKLWCDNQHFEIDFPFFHEKIQLELISTRDVKTGEQLGDIFTKPFSGNHVSYLYNKLSIINIYTPT